MSGPRPVKTLIALLRNERIKVEATALVSDGGASVSIRRGESLEVKVFKSTKQKPALKMAMEWMMQKQKDYNPQTDRVTLSDAVDCGF